MHLSTSEVERFYGIWFPLLHFVNQHRKVVASFPKVWRDAHVSPEVAVPLRNALWEDDALRESFIAENPAHLSAEDLALVASWKYRVAGDFFIFRHSKQYTLFLLEGSPARAYGVLGLTSSIEEVVGSHVPIYVQAVLLPFENRIIYDSLLSQYPVLFGGGIRSSLKDTYRAIQEREGVITTLLPDPDSSTPKNLRKSAQERNRKLITTFQKSLGQAGLSPKMIQTHSDSISDFAEHFLLAQTPPRLLLDLTLADLKSYIKDQKQKVNLVSFKRFLWFLRDTGRMDYDEAETLLEFIKGKQGHS